MKQVSVHVSIIYLFIFSFELLSLSISEIVVTFEAISIGIWAILSWFSWTAFEIRCGAVERVLGAHMDELLQYLNG